MDIKELRVGNKIWRPCCYDEVLEIRENGIIGLDSLRGLIPYSDISPIPITEEILKKCGFKEMFGRGCDSYEINLYNYHRIEVVMDENIIDVHARYGGWKCHLRTIKYLHELQNIVRAINSQELEIKL